MRILTESISYAHTSVLVRDNGTWPLSAITCAMAVKLDVRPHPSTYRGMQSAYSKAVEAAAGRGSSKGGAPRFQRDASKQAGTKQAQHEWPRREDMH